MFVITADQIDSRHDRDRAGEMIAELDARYGTGFALPPDQTAGDEIQVMVIDAQIALNALLLLHRSGYWSVGLGIGAVRTPLPTSTRQSSGGAFIAARDAVTRAKKTDAHVAVHMLPAVGSVLTAEQVEALLTMLLLLRQRRSEAGWEAVDLLEDGHSQVDIAAILGISTAAVSQRVKATQFRVEQTARPAIVRLLENLDRSTSETDTPA